MTHFRYFVLLALLFVSIMVSAQKKPDIRRIDNKMNRVDATLGGNGLLLSVNYSRIISVRSNYFTEAGAGLGFFAFASGLTLPHHFSFNFGRKSSFFEAGLGGVYWSGKTDASGYEERSDSYQISPIIGWRKHYKNSMVLRVFASPLFHISGEYFYEDYAVVPYGGISFGYRF